MYRDMHSDQFKSKHRHNRSSSLLQSEVDKTQSYNLYEWGSFFADSKLSKKECFFGNGNSQPQQYKIDLPSDCVIENISCGLNHLTILMNTGDLYGLGSNDQGQLGTGEFSWPSQSQNQPMPIRDLMFKGLKVSMVACGFSHTIVATSTYQLYSWGYGKFGALGLGTYESKNSPQQVKFFEQNLPARPQAISCGAHHSSMIDTHGRLYMWGAGEVGQLGSGYRSNECYPVMITKGFANTDFKAVACGNFHTLALTKHGRVIIAGIAYPQTCNEALFKQIVEIPKSEKIEAKDQSAVLTVDGQLLIWDEKSQPKAVKFKGPITDFELSKNFVFFRSSDSYFTYSMATKQVQPVSFNTVDSLNIVAFGSKFVVGLGKCDQPVSMEGTNKSNTLDVDDNRRSKSSNEVGRQSQLRSCFKRDEQVPTSMRISYDEDKLNHHQKSHFIEQQNSPLKPYSRNERPQPIPTLSFTEKKSAPKSTTNKQKLKDALSSEIDKRVALENELKMIKEEFIKLKQGVEVSDVKKIITESQEEYQKLYEICVNECEKQAKLSDQLQRERIEVQSKEDQIREMDKEMRQLRYDQEVNEKQKEDRLREMCADIEGYQRTILDLQKHIERLKQSNSIESEKHQNEMSNCEISLRESRKQIEMLEVENRELKHSKDELTHEFTDMKDDYSNIKNQQQDFIAKKQLVVKLQREVQELNEENVQIKSTLAEKNELVKEMEVTIQELSNKMGEMQKDFEEEKLTKRVNRTFSTGKKKAAKSQTRPPTSASKINQSATKKQSLENRFSSFKKVQQKREQSPEKLRNIINQTDEQSSQFIADITCMLDPAGTFNSAEKQKSRNQITSLQESSDSVKAFSKSVASKPPRTSRPSPVDRKFTGTVKEYVKKRSNAVSEQDELESMQPENPEDAPTPMSVKQKDPSDIDLNALYDCMTKDAKTLKSCDVGELKSKLDTIRMNKTLLEGKIKEYEKKLYRT